MGVRGKRSNKPAHLITKGASTGRQDEDGVAIDQSLHLVLHVPGASIGTGMYESYDIEMTRPRYMMDALTFVPQNFQND